MRRVLGLLVIMSLSHLYLAGQAPVTSGARVRITSRNEPQAETGQVLTATADTIVIEVKGIRTVNYRQVYGIDTLAFPVADIDRLEASRHTGNSRGRGALIGLFVGAGAGAVIGSATYEPCPAQAWLCFEPSSSGEAAVLGAVAFGVLGAGVGALIGSTIPADKWETVPVRAAYMRPLPHNQIGLGFTATF
jgi:hypothetical protein